MRMLIALGSLAALLTAGALAQSLIPAPAGGAKTEAAQPATAPAAEPASSDPVLVKLAALEQRLYTIDTKLSRENQGSAFAEINQKLNDILRKLDKLERDIDDLERDVRRN